MMYQEEGGPDAEVAVRAWRGFVSGWMGLEGTKVRISTVCCLLGFGCERRQFGDFFLREIIDGRHRGCCCWKSVLEREVNAAVHAGLRAQSQRTRQGYNEWEWTQAERTGESGW